MRRAHRRAHRRRRDVAVHFVLRRPHTAGRARARGDGILGRTVSLPFTGSDAKGEVAAQIVVKRGTRALAHQQGNFFRINAGKSYSFAWKAPTRKVPGAFTFCLTLADRAGNRSAKTCAPIRLS